MLNLNWENAGPDRGPGWRRVLLVGVNEHPIASMEKRAKHWQGHIDLPGLSVRTEYAPKHVMEADIEQKVRAWFAAAVQP